MLCGHKASGRLWMRQNLKKALSCTYVVTIGGSDGLKAEPECQLADPLACTTWLYDSTAAHTLYGSSYPHMRGFAAGAAEESMEHETSVQGSLRRKAERKVCTCCKVDKPASEFRVHRKSRDGLQHFCIPCKVIEAEVLGIRAPPTGVTADEGVCACCKQLKPAAEFHRRSRAKTGLMSWCKACTEVAAKQRRKKYLESSSDRSTHVVDKVCGRCHTEKRPEEFHRDNYTLDGLKGHCRQCTKIVGHLSYQRTPATLQPSDTRVCRKCGREVPSSNFHARKRSATGLQSWCKDCRRRGGHTGGTNQPL